MEINIPKQKFADGPGWSPDGGAFWAKGGKVFWSDGNIWEPQPGEMIRLSVFPITSGEDFSSWSDEKRANIREAANAKYAANKAQEATDKQERTQLRESAKAKLTEQEFDACRHHDYD